MSAMINIRFSACLKVAAITIALTAFSGVSSAESLSDAVQAALGYHPSVVAARAGKDALHQEQKEKFSDFLPHINARATGGREFSDNSTSRGLNTTRGEGYSWLWEGNVTVTQLLFDGFETPNRYGAAKARKSSSEYNIADVRERLGLQTVVTYLDLLRNEEILANLRGHEALISDYITRINNLVDEGAADETMSVRAKDIRAQLKATLANTDGQLRSAIAAYQAVTGHMPEAPMDRPVPPLDMIPEDVNDAKSYAMDKHPMIVSASLTEKSFKYEAKAESSVLFPDFTGEVSALKRDLDDVIGGEVTDYKALVRINWDYSIGGAQHARRKKALYRQTESRAEMNEMVRQVKREIEVSYSDRETAIRQLDIFDERVGLNEDLLKTNKAQFEAARVNLLNLLQTENALFNARLAHVNGEYGLLASQYAVLASMGRLQEALSLDIIAPNDQ